MAEFQKKWLRIHYDTSAGEGSKLVIADVTTEAPGLALHESLAGDVAEGKSGWTVTHVRSGRAFTGALGLSRDVAEKMLVELAKCGDWMRARRTLQGDRGLQFRVVETIERVNKETADAAHDRRTETPHGRLRNPPVLPRS